MSEELTIYNSEGRELGSVDVIRESDDTYKLAQISLPLLRSPFALSFGDTFTGYPDAQGRFVLTGIVHRAHCRVVLIKGISDAHHLQQVRSHLNRIAAAGGSWVAEPSSQTLWLAFPQSPPLYEEEAAIHHLLDATPCA